MKIIIIGGGLVGTSLAKRLLSEDHDLTIIDQDPEICQTLAASFDLAVVTGNGAHLSTLKQAGIESAEMLIAASGKDEANLAACLLANQAGVKKIIARVGDPEFYSSGSAHDSKAAFGIDLFIRPEAEVASEAVRLILRSFASEVYEFESGSFVIACLKIDESFNAKNTRLAELGDSAFRERFRLLAIKRPKGTLVPRGEDWIEPNDLVVLATRTNSLPGVLKFFGKVENKAHRVIILGANLIGQEIARQLVKARLRVKVVDRDKEACLRLASELPEVDVLHCEKNEIDTMALAGILETDAFVAVSANEENNILLSLITRHLGVKRSIALVARSAYQPFLGSLGIATSLNPQQATANAILRYVRKGEVVSVASFHGVEAEAIEFVLPDSSPLVGLELKEAKLPPNLLVAAIINDKSTIPLGSSRFRAGDRVIVFALSKNRQDAERIFT